MRTRQALSELIEGRLSEILIDRVACSGST